MASKFMIDQAIADSNEINQSPTWNWFGNNNQGIASPSMNVPQNMRPYFSGTNPGAYGSGDWRSNMNQLYNWGDSGARYNYDRPYEMSDVAGEVGEYSQRPGHGIMATNQAQDKGNFLKRILDSTVMGQIMGGFKDNPEEAFGRDYFNITDSGRVAGSPIDNLYSGMNVSSMFGKGLDTAGQKRIGNIQKTIDKWEKAAAEGDEYAIQKLKETTLYDRIKKFKANQARYQGDLNAQTGQGGTAVIPPVITSQGDQVNTGGGQRDTSGWDSPGYSTRSGFAPRQTAASQHAGAGAIRDVRGHHSWADGGRIGKQEGGRIGFFEGGSFKDFLETNIGHLDESIQDDIWDAYGSGDQGRLIKLLQIHIGFEDRAQGGRVGYAFAGPVGVEQQTDFIEGPQGGEEFQETVVEGQEQPSKEQLEALAMHIFQLPLDQLDDQQLVVVYQAAMQGQPMEEAVQEEDVQFAANGGLAGLL